ncbi:hypothetical protein Tco_0913446 [Tanacetum coccineum]
MANENVPAPAPIRSDEKILPFAAWVPIGKSNFVLDLQKNFQLDEHRFTLDANILREALEITPIDQAHQFVSPLSGDAILDFVNEMGYTKEIHFVSKMVVNNLYQPWRAILSMINQSSPFYLVEEDHRLGNLKFLPKGEDDEVFGMPIPNELITNIIRNTPYYNAYLEMVANYDQKIAAKKGGKKKLATAKQLKPKPVKEKSSKLAPAPKPKKVHKGKSSLQLIDEDESTQPEPEPELEHQGEREEYDIERDIQMSLESFQAQGQAHVGATEEASTGPSTQPQDDASANIVHDSLSPANAETGADIDKTNSGGDTEILQIGEEQGEDLVNMIDQEEKTTELNEGQAGSDPGKTPESRPPPDDDKMDEDQAGPDPGESCMALARPNPEPTHEEFMANVYPNVHESLKFLADEHVILEDPLILPLSTSVIDLLPPKLVSSTTQAPIFTTITTTTTTTLLLPPPPQQQSATNSKLVTRVTALEKKFSDFEQKSNTLDNTTQNLRSRVFTLKLRDLPQKINQTVNEVVKEAVHRSLPEHVALYEALEAYMEWGNIDEFLAEKDKSCKRRHDDQVPPPPLPDLDLSKKKRHDSDASGSTQPPAPQSST